MAILIKLLRASTLDELEKIVNEFFAVEAEDVRVESSMAGGITFANGEYVAPVRLSAPHKRRFETVAQEKETQEKAAVDETEAQAEATRQADANVEDGNANTSD